MRTRGFTLIELLVVIAIIAILAAILFPVFAKAREKARQTKCMNNQRQIVLSTQIYAQDHDETMPEATTAWQDIKIDKGTLACPSAARFPLGYVYSNNVAGKSIGELDPPTACVVSADGKHEPQGADGTYAGVAYASKDILTRHAGSAIYSFADGHVELAKAKPLLPYPIVPVTDGLVMWMRGDSITSSNGAQVTSWTGSSPGNAVTATLASGTKPTFAEAGINGVPALFFPSTGIYFNTTDLSSLFGSSTNGTLFLVFDPEGTGSSYYEPFWCSGRGDTFTSFNGTAYPGAFRPDRIDNFCTGMPTNSDGPCRVAYVSGTGNGTYALYLNGALKNSGNPNWRTPTVCRIGQNGTPNGYMTGYLGEIILYNRALATVELSKVDAYIKSKYGM